MAMTYEQFQDALRQKITSKEQFCNLLVEAHPDNSRAWGNECDMFSLEGRLLPRREAVKGLYWPWLRWHLSFHGAGPRVPASQWWLAREWLRVFYGVYALTPHMWDWVACADSVAQCVPHLALDGEDKTMIAYTPTVDDGLRDRQVRTSVSKFLRKTCLVLTDNYIRDLEAQHRAEVVDEVAFLTGTAIIDAYMSGRPESCMAKSVECFKTMGQHPVRAYAETPEISLAVLYDSSGNINARALCYINPDNPDDKRYVRVYGDTSLERRLERRGFQRRGLAGARLKRIMLDDHPESDSRRSVVLFPYIDPPGGPSGSSEPSHVHGAVPEGEWWRLLSAEQAKRVRVALDRSPLELSSATGWCYLGDPKYWLEEYRGVVATCPLSNAELDLLTAETVEVWHEGAIKRAGAKAAADAGFTRKAWALSNDGDDKRREVLVGPAEPVFGVGTGLAVDTPRGREYFGWVRLDAELYPQEQEYFDSRKVVRAAKVDAEGRVVLDENFNVVELVVKPEDVRRVVAPEDARRVVASHYQARGRTTHIHKTHLEALKGRLVRLASVPGWRDALFALPGVPVRTTPSGRKVVIGVHAVSETVDGTVDYLRNLTRVNGFLGLSFYYRSGEHGDPTLDSDYWRPKLKVLLKAKHFSRCTTRLQVFNGMVLLMRALSAGLFSAADLSGELQWMGGSDFSVSSLDDTYMRQASVHLEQGRINADRILNGELDVSRYTTRGWFAGLDNAKLASRRYKLCYELAAEAAADLGVASPAQAAPVAEAESAATDEEFILAAE